MEFDRVYLNEPVMDNVRMRAIELATAYHKQCEEFDRSLQPDGIPVRAGELGLMHRNAMKVRQGMERASLEYGISPSELQDAIHYIAHRLASAE